MRHAICYISNLEGEADLKQIKELLDYCQERNTALDIKGLLIYSEKNFFQILEGEKKEVLELYEKIKKDPRHHGIIQVIGRDIKKGSYDGYIADILKANTKYENELPDEYLEALEGLDPDLKGSMKGMLETFIATR